MHIQTDTVVAIDYTLKNDAGEVIDRSEAEALFYLHGHGNIVEGLEEQLEGKSVGDRVQVSVPPEKGYGEYDEERIQQIPSTALPSDVEPQKGTTLYMGTQSGHQIPVRITKVLLDSVEIDANHELAGTTLHFDVTVKEVRRATREELEHGHAHSPGHHHH